MFWLDLLDLTYKRRITPIFIYFLININKKKNKKEANQQKSFIYSGKKNKNEKEKICSCLENKSADISKTTHTQQHKAC